MELSIHKSVFQHFPELTVKGLIATNIETEKLPPLSPSKMTINQDVDHKTLVKQWQKIYKEFPTDKKARCSVEYLIWAHEKEKLRNIHPLVDLYNQASLMTLAPFGGEDMDILGEKLFITTATGEETFLPLGKTETEPPRPGEILWATTENKIVCRSLNWLESDIFKITPQSKNIVFVSERPSPDFPDATKGITLLEQTLRAVSSQVVTFTLNRENALFTFSPA